MANAPTTPPGVKPTVTATKPVATATVGGAGSPQPTQVALKAPAFKITPLKKRERYLKMLVYGNYGVGKTHLAGTAAQVERMRDVLLINVEAGDLTLDEFSNIDQTTITTFSQLARVHEFLTAHCKVRDAGDVAKMTEYQERFFGVPVSEDMPLRKYRTVIIDSLSEVNEYCLNQLLGVAANTKLDEDPQAAEFKEYKQNHTMILRLVREFRNLPMNVIFTCAEEYTQDEMKRQHFTPQLTGKLSKKVQGFMDMVGYYVQGKPTEEAEGGGKSATPAGTRIPRFLFVVPDQKGKHDAKHRYAKFKDTHFKDPTIAKILKETGLLDAEGAPLS